MDDLRFGLKESTIDQINNVFAAYPQVKQVIIYGSRAKGNYRNGSDIDLTMLGDELAHSHLLRIANDLDDLLLPYKIDLSLLHQISNPDLVQHIRRGGKVFYEKAED